MSDLIDVFTKSLLNWVIYYVKKIKVGVQYELVNVALLDHKATQK